jgi:hypothetical protein
MFACAARACCGAGPRKVDQVKEPALEFVRKDYVSLQLATLRKHACALAKSAYSYKLET